jgi:ATP-binding cassette subfamily C protein
MVSGDATITLRSYALTLARFAGAGRLACLSVLFLATALTDGVGLFLLVPILEILASPAGAHSPITRALVALGLPPTLHGLLLTFVLIIALRAVLVHVRDVATNRLMLEFVDHIRARLLTSVARAAWPFLAQRRLSDVANAFAADVIYIAGGTYFALQLPALLLLILVQAGVAIRLAPLLAMGTLVCAAMLGVALRGQLRRVHELGRAATTAQEEIFHEMSEFLSGMKLAKSSAAEERHVAACVSATVALRSQQLRFIRANSASYVAFQVGAAVAMALLVYLGSTVTRLPLAELVVLGAVFARMLPIVLGSLNKLQELVHTLPAFESVEKLIGECEQAAEPDDMGPTPALASELRLEDVSFRYGEADGAYALREIALTIPAGRTIAVTGPSGAGKSTLADLVMGLLEPTQGWLAIDGERLGPARSRAWRRSIAYVPQECFLFRDSVRANLLWARPDAGDPDLWGALRMVAADGFVSALPRGLDTVLGDRGLRLSGGERQRLALARAVLREPQLLVLDEATSALDNDNERLVQAAIERMHGLTTILLIAHRLTTIRRADEIVVLAEGRIIERGTWDDLAGSDGWLATALKAHERSLETTMAT